MAQIDYYAAQVNALLAKAGTSVQPSTTGNLADLTTTNKDNLVAAINEVKAAAGGDYAERAEAAAAEAEEVLESIPEDYSDLSAEVGDLKSAIDYTNERPGYKLTIWSGFPIHGYRVRSSDGAVESNAACHMTDFLYIKDLTRLKAYLFANDKTYAIAFYDSSRTLLTAISEIINTEGATWKSYDIDLTGVSYDSACYIRVTSVYINGLGGEAYLYCYQNGDIVAEIIGINDNLDYINSRQQNYVYFNYPNAYNNVGIINLSGGVGTNTNCRYTDYIDISGLSTLKAKTYLNNSGTAIAFYDASKNFLSGISKVNTEMETDYIIDLTDAAYSSAKYVRLSNYVGTDDTYGQTCYIYAYKNKDLLDCILHYKAANKLYGKTIAFVGDSITSTDYVLPCWPQIIAARTNCTALDYGISATTLAHDPDTHLNDYHFGHLDPEEIGYDADDPSTWTTGNCVCERWRKVSQTADAVVVMCGTNDWHTPRGEYNSTDTTTFFGGLNVLILGLLDRFPGKPIVICTMMQYGTDYNQTNYVDLRNRIINVLPVTSVMSVRERAECIKMKCEQYGIYCCDVFDKSGINGADTNKVYYRGSGDITHPSAYGQAHLANIIQSALEDVI